MKLIRSFELYLIVAISLSLHLLLLQLEVVTPAITLQGNKQSIGYVERPLAQFYLPTRTVAAVPAVLPRESIRQNDYAHAAPFKPEKQIEPVQQKPVVQEVPRIKPASQIQKAINKQATPEPERIEIAKPKPKVVDVGTRNVESVTEIRTSKKLVDTPVTILETEIAPAGNGMTAASDHRPIDGDPAAAKSAAVAKSPADSYQAALPRYDTNPPPRYPDVARRRGLEGTVQLAVQVLASGRVERAEILTTSGHKSLDQAARKSVRRWLFKPAIAEGVPVSDQIVVPIDFVLK